MDSTAHALLSRSETRLRVPPRLKGSACTGHVWGCEDHWASLGGLGSWEGTSAAQGKSCGVEPRGRAAFELAKVEKGSLAEVRLLSV